MIDTSRSGHYIGDCRELLRQLPDACVQTCVTSPPYWGLRDYGTDGQIGLEATPDEYVAGLVDVFEHVRRVLRDDGTLWLNLGDSYAGNGRGDKNSRPGNTAKNGGASNRNVHGIKPKDLIGLPWLAAFALRSAGWYLRQDIIWHKPNPMPESVRDRCTKAHEYLFLLSKSERYHCDINAIAELAVGPIGIAKLSRQGKRDDIRRTGIRDRNGLSTSTLGSHEGPKYRHRRSVWTITSQPYAGAHLACFPPRLIEPCILAGSRHGDIVLDPFFGSGTTGLVAARHGRRWIGFDLNPKYAELAKERALANAAAICW